jgi:hypothetical protein
MIDSNTLKPWDIQPASSPWTRKLHLLYFATSHDVFFKNAISLEECGHSFCDECAKASLHQNEVLPNCRVVVTGFIPNYCVKELVGPMEVICLNGKAGSVQCNDGEELSCGCHWSLVRQMSIFAKSWQCMQIQGSYLQCGWMQSYVPLFRYDNASAGGFSFIQHMNLMKQSITKSRKSWGEIWRN